MLSSISLPLDVPNSKNQRLSSKVSDVFTSNDDKDVRTDETTSEAVPEDAGKTLKNTDEVQDKEEPLASPTEDIEQEESQDNPGPRSPKRS